MDDIMDQGSGSKFRQWSLSLGAIASLVGAVLMLAVVVATYVQHDVLRVRGVVLTLVLLGIAAIVRSEAHAYVPVQRNRS